MTDPDGLIRWQWRIDLRWRGETGFEIVLAALKLIEVCVGVDDEFSQAVP